MVKKTGLLYYIRNYKFQSLFIKNLLLIFLLTVVPFAGMGLAVYYQMNGIVREEISSVNLNSLSRLRDVVDTVFEQTDRMATMLTLQDDAVQFVFAADPGQIANTLYTRLNNYIISLSSTYNYIDSIYIYSERNKYLISNNYQTGPLDTIDDKSWYSSYMKRADNNPSVMARRRANSYPYYISLIRPMYIYYQEKYGAVVVNIDVEKLGEVIGRKRSNLEERLFIVDDSDQIVFSDTRSELFTDAKKNQFLTNLPLGESASKSSIETIGGIQYVVSVAKSEQYDWRYVLLLPINHYNEKMIGLRNFMTIFAAVGMIVIIVVSFLISKRTFSPVKQIMSIFDVSSKALGSTMRERNELRFILSNITMNINSQHELEGELERRMVLLSKARSLALQAQINPHFLFNTLDTIKWMAIRLTGGNNEVSHMLSSLSDLMRLSTDSDSHLIVIESEIEHARKYLDIIEYRYKNKIIVQWAIDEEILPYKIVQLILQPLLENAVLHGMKPKRYQGTIRIEGKSIGDDIVIEVSDDGVGMDAEKMRQLNEGFAQEHDLVGKHIGLPNVNQRIKLIFGDNYGLQVRNGAVSGTTVSIRLPKVSDELSILETKT
ncbi:hypothetical protein A8709_05105 [Paenibacillus pectinilyticus]|uniref:Histidine kinase domain-containing protein n=1 Tax=Paenibacillus pectinilyticus TaxID=512399 RepID=A0A1C0ZSM8_9BACL|nr:sensor histidine kinase [Paenibacillus pectinilyticus]OCT11076.1 hypothetical protein A8709_05105 [Paenibacillus pectinilyticus]